MTNHQIDQIGQLTFKEIEEINDRCYQLSFKEITEVLEETRKIILKKSQKRGGKQK